MLSHDLRVWPHMSFHLLEEVQNPLIVRFTYLCHSISDQRMVGFPFLRVYQAF